MVLLKALTASQRRSFLHNAAAKTEEKRILQQCDDNPRVFMDIVADGVPAGRVVIELDQEKAPMTSKNFLALCTGSHVPIDKRLHYESTILHRIVTGMYVCGGDIVNGNGTSGLSIYGPNFQDEYTDLKHDEPGIVSMFSHGPDTNNSQFFITLKPMSWMDDFFIPFAKVVTGLDVLQQLAVEYGSESGLPRSNGVRIVTCGKVTNSNNNNVNKKC